MTNGNKAPSFQNTTSTNPYASSTVTSKGTTTTLNPFLSGVNSFVEQNIPGLNQQLLNPSLDNPVTAARKNLFYDQFNEQSNKNFENNLINPLASRNMLRSSTANDLANNLQKQQTQQISNFNNQLISQNQQDTQGLIDSLYNQYLVGANLGQQTLGSAQQANQAYNNWALQQFQAQQQANAAGNSWMGPLASAIGTIGGAALGGPVGAALGGKAAGTLMAGSNNAFA